MAEVWSQNVFSSVATKVGWDDELGLIVTWKNGKRSAYEGVPEKKAHQLANAPSVGGMLNSEIKDVFPHRYI